MSKRRSNKSVKAMICGEVVKNTNANCAWFSDKSLCAQVPSDDEYCSYDDIRIKQGKTSLTASELKKKG